MFLFFESVCFIPLGPVGGGINLKVKSDLPFREKDCASYLCMVMFFR